MEQADRAKASALLDELTFGGHSQDGAIETLARALADQRARGYAEGRAAAEAVETEYLDVSDGYKAGED